MKRKYNVFITILVLVLTIFFCQGCLKENDLRWKLPRDNEGDARQNILNKRCKLYNCESSEDFIYASTGSSSWGIMPWGYKGNCFMSGWSTEPSAVIQLMPKNQTPISITFWARVDNDYKNVDPFVYINGVKVNLAILKEYNGVWRKYQTPVIKDLNCTISFVYENTSNSRSKTYYLDEVEILCK